MIQFSHTQTNLFHNCKCFPGVILTYLISKPIIRSLEVQINLSLQEKANPNKNKNKMLGL